MFCAVRELPTSAEPSTFDQFDLWSVANGARTGVRKAPAAIEATDES